MCCELIYLQEKTAQLAASGQQEHTSGIKSRHGSGDTQLMSVCSRHLRYRTKD